MVDLFNLELPETIEVEGSSYFIQTDFRYFVLFYRLINTNLPVEEFAFMFPYEVPENMQEAINQILEFANPPRILPRTTESLHVPVLDYTIDSDYIYSAFLEQYQIDLLDPTTKLHWYKFQALLVSLHGTKLNEIMSYRCYTEKTPDQKQELKSLKQAWQLEEPETAEEKKAREDFDSLFE